MTTADRVKTIIAKHLSVEIEKVIENASIMEDLGADSLDGVEIVMDLEGEFGIEIDDLEAETWVTVGDAIKAVEKRLG
ncbi:acyl carrier protein [Mesorhizobium neociceri]|uniref:Acyl carrier protein n=1 Tax=Mesorhizobium neociceri TaxID=1307853 RepID=A0A838B8M5_9HYPH|nr:acyl carrier protein [Mesorhizobium neociceri]MBA1141720.1 acyl carrier protein [Mesorhizobium neociceri]